MSPTRKVTFGLALTPSATHPEHTIAQAQLGERSGFDLVTLLRAPGQVVDGWTLLSWIAGSTERIGLLGQLACLPSEMPTVTAGAAASLDLLSQGRLTLAITSDEPSDDNQHPVEGVEETLDIIRRMWAIGEPGTVRYTGNVHRVDGAQRGPAPAHDVPLLITGDSPELLRLAGEKSDGWLSEINGSSLDRFIAGSTLIGHTAVANGRDPREVPKIVTIRGTFADTRGGFLHGRSADWVDDLLPLIVDHGVTTLLLATEENAVLQQFAEEVAPRLRDAASSLLPAQTRTGRLRKSTAIAQRRSGIRYDDVPDLLVDSAIEPGDFDFPRVKSTYLRGGSPGLVLRTRTVDEVVAALGFAREHPHLPLSIRSGGHGISGRSTNDGGIVINLSLMNRIDVLDEATRRVRIEPGARWMDVAAALQPYGWALTSGDYGGVGVGGLATAGGIGFLGRGHGLTIDHLRAVDMVLADGSRVRASDTENTELFWAVRGAGANFGIVTAFEFEVDEVGDVGWAQLGLDATDTAEFLEKWGHTSEAAPRDTTSFLIMGPPRHGQPALAQLMAMVDSANPDTIIERLQPFANISPLYSQSVQLMPYAAVMANAQGESNGGQGEPVTRSGLLDHITPEFAAAAARLISSGTVYFFQIRAVGGAISDIDADATAYAHRSANFSVVAFGSHRQRLDAAWEELYPFFTGAYLSFETDPRPERLTDAFPPATLARLREVKARLDPDSVFRDNFPISIPTLTEATS
ncbi:alkanesulfonate monooxygenase SsuD/methylene tetrahydromethanopterin reductase-like flavin-dependent oxidoreductase (luciferase family) [Okibacterium sp. HSC-33S16]|uniref:LLM class flavin-dependent oxidoreductase n=1 Tax=Okibacterium sp. HSC-33S16 TaxID=2910965 RepID=UPI00209E22E7|nr:LLM class flavin-dependent oxidoreductase [Okibacterium sp. HSC-33S16]MCP2032965.1 alkanesulfonate monooxygenase SsuD/methylene tetrahydromethanopterin reductase-like flavin-dependent oxidoreductase (luciferase family) [Okibacterium sp. HSC-33S16]